MLDERERRASGDERGGGFLARCGLWLLRLDRLAGVRAGDWVMKHPEATIAEEVPLAIELGKCRQIHRPREIGIGHRPVHGDAGPGVAACDGCGDCAAIGDAEPGCDRGPVEADDRRGRRADHHGKLGRNRSEASVGVHLPHEASGQAAKGFGFGCCRWRWVRRRARGRVCGRCNDCKDQGRGSGLDAPKRDARLADRGESNAVALDGHKRRRGSRIEIGERASAAEQGRGRRVEMNGPAARVEECERLMFAIDEGRRRKPDLEDALAAGVDADEQCSIAFMNETEPGRGEHDRLREAAVGRPQVFETRSSRGRKGRDQLAGCLTERAERLGSAGNGFRQRARAQEGEAGAVGEAELARGIDQERGRGRRDEGCDACVR